ncbi:hypothetical protein FRC17_007113 [Serendipita sp. 399]|nr:hypothetical protein FRC17_007113 [Serendipita sp. 399]
MENLHKDVSTALDAISILIEADQQCVEMPTTVSLSQTQPSTPISCGSTDKLTSSSVSRMTRSKNLLPESDAIDDFKRARTKFTPDQIRELEHLFYTYGPHPTREQRVAVAEKIQVPPRTVQVFLQNRRQRDTKNTVALSDAELAKEQAKESNRANDDALGLILSQMMEGGTSLPSRDGDDERSQTAATTTNNHLPISSPSHLPKVAPRSKPRPLATRTVSLDQVAAMVENGRRVPKSNGMQGAAKNQAKPQKLSVPAGIRSVLSSSPMLDKLVLDELKTPIKSVTSDCQLADLAAVSSCQTAFAPHQRGLMSTSEIQGKDAPVFKKPAAPPPRESCALWTRMISSSPTALSPVINRQHGSANTIREITVSSLLETGADKRRSVDTGVLVADKEEGAGSNLELARALANACDRRSRKTLKLSEEELSSQYRTRATLSVLKRFREENGENEVPRKRTSLDGLRKPLHRPVGLGQQHPSLNSEMRSRKYETVVVECTDASVTGDDDSYAPTSPNSISSGLADMACRGSGGGGGDLPLDGLKKPVEKKGGREQPRPALQIRKQDAVIGPTRGISTKNAEQSSITDLSALEANAALVLASFFSKI